MRVVIRKGRTDFDGLVKDLAPFTVTCRFVSGPELRALAYQLTDPEWLDALAQHNITVEQLFTSGFVWHSATPAEQEEAAAEAARIGNVFTRAVGFAALERDDQATSASAEGVDGAF